jgi:hypothetical protein
MGVKNILYTYGTLVDIDIIKKLIHDVEDYDPNDDIILEDYYREIDAEISQKYYEPLRVIELPHDLFKNDEKQLYMMGIILSENEKIKEYGSKTTSVKIEITKKDRDTISNYLQKILTKHDIKLDNVDIQYISFPNTCACCYR